MAGGIDWFRWHHGTATDQKFPLIARRANASVAEAIAVWACVLESASQNAEHRGALPSLPDFEAMDCALGLVEGRSQAIFDAMTDRRLIDASLQLTAWSRRQPKRERDEAGASTARSQAHRQRQRATAGDAEGNAAGNHETPCNATERTETPRVEESREEEITPIGVPSPSETSHLVGVEDASGRGDSIPGCPHRELLKLFGEKAPSLPQPMPELWAGAKADNLRARWRWMLTAKRSSGKKAGQRYASTKDEALSAFGRIFAMVEESDFLTGRSGAWHGCSLDWLVKQGNFDKVLQGNYENVEHASSAMAGAI